MKIFYAILIAGGLVLLYGFLYLLNKRTPVPEGCENLKPDCAACGIKDCSVRAKVEDINEHIAKEIEENHGNS